MKLLLKIRIILFFLCISPIYGNPYELPEYEMNFFRQGTSPEISSAIAAMEKFYDPFALKVSIAKKMLSNNDAKLKQSEKVNQIFLSICHDAKVEQISLSILPYVFDYVKHLPETDSFRKKILDFLSKRLDASENNRTLFQLELMYPKVLENGKKLNRVKEDKSKTLVEKNHAILLKKYINSSDPVEMGGILSLTDSYEFAPRIKTEILRKLLDDNEEASSPISMSRFGYLLNSMLNDANNDNLSTESVPLILEFMRNKVLATNQYETPIKLLEKLLKYNPGFTVKFIREYKETDESKIGDFIDKWEAFYLRLENSEPKTK